MDFFPNGIALVSLVALAAQGLRVLVEQQREIADRRHTVGMEALRLQAAVLTAPHQPQFPALTHGTLQAPPGAPSPPVVTEAPTPALPGVTTLGQVLDTGWRPSRDAILLGQGPGGVNYTVPLPRLLHALLVGPTNVGKSTIERLIVPQLQVIGCETEWWNPHYTPRDFDTDEDWEAIAAHTRAGRALSEEAEILAALEALALQELPARKARYRQGLPPGPPRFYVIDEAPILAGYDKRFMEWLGTILREGRKFGLYVIMATQDALVSTLGGHSGMRAQAQTIYYGGGDRYSAKALLGFVPADPPGQGVVWLKSAATPDVQQVRVPWPQNADLARLYGPTTATTAPLRPTTVPTTGVVDAVVGPPPVVVGEVVDAVVGAVVVDGRPVDAETLDKVRAGIAAGKSAGETAQGITGSKGGDRYGWLCRVYTACIVAMRDELAFYRTLAS
jgi:hypothetical protein